MKKLLDDSVIEIWSGNYKVEVLWIGMLKSFRLNADLQLMAIL